MTQATAPRIKIPTKSPQPARGQAGRPGARAKGRRPAPGRVLANGTGRAATRGGGEVIELEQSVEHLPRGWKDRFGAWIDWTWAFVLEDLGGGKIRFIFRSRGRAGPAWVAAAYLLAVIPADFVMSRQMLRGVRVRGERTTAADLHQPGAHRSSCPRAGCRCMDHGKCRGGIAWPGAAGYAGD